MLFHSVYAYGKCTHVIGSLTPTPSNRGGLANVQPLLFWSIFMLVSFLLKQGLCVSRSFPYWGKVRLEAAGLNEIG